jgi:hypothetical protein
MGLQLHEPRRQGRLGVRVEEHRAALPFALHVSAFDRDALDDPSVLEDIAHSEGEQLGDPKPRLDAQDKHGPIPGGITPAEAPLHLRDFLIRQRPTPLHRCLSPANLPFSQNVCESRV